jgi:hypothetical protein
MVEVERVIVVEELRKPEKSWDTRHRQYGNMKLDLKETGL